MSLNVDTHTLITKREALKILTWLKPSSLVAGWGGAKELTAFYTPGHQRLYSKEECEALRDRIIQDGLDRRDKREFDGRKIPTELVV